MGETWRSSSCMYGVTNWRAWRLTLLCLDPIWSCCGVVWIENGSLCFTFVWCWFLWWTPLKQRV